MDHPKPRLPGAQLEVGLDTAASPSAITTALESLDDLGAAVDDLLWKLRDAALTNDANSFASCGSRSRQRVRSVFSLLGLARFEATVACGRAGAPVSTCARRRDSTKSQAGDRSARFRR